MDNLPLSAPFFLGSHFTSILVLSLCSLCIETLIEILSLPSSAASKEDSSDLAKKLIVLALNDPSNYFFNNILQLEAVKNLESQNEKVYEVCAMLVTGKNRVSRD